MLRDAEGMGRPRNNNVQNIVEVRGVDDLQDARVALRKGEGFGLTGFGHRGSWMTLNALRQ